MYAGWKNWETWEANNWNDVESDMAAELYKEAIDNGDSREEAVRHVVDALAERMENSYSDEVDDIQSRFLTSILITALNEIDWEAIVRPVVEEVAEEYENGRR